MAVSTIEILQLVSDIGEEEGIKVAVTESLKGGLITGAIASVGGLLLGPIGLAAGGAIGGFASFCLSKGKFEPISKVIMNMDSAKKELLVTRVKKILGEVNHADLIQITLLIAQPQIKQRLVEELINFVKTDMKMQTIC